MAMLSFNAPGEREKSLWLVKKETNPNHSQWYIDRFKAMEAEGNDMAGESRMVNALASRGAKILDAGSGPGRVGKQLHALGHRVTGVDIDPELIEEARRVCPDATWITADLVDLPEVLGIEGDATAENGFELLVCAGKRDGFPRPFRPVSRWWRTSAACWPPAAVRWWVTAPVRAAITRSSSSWPMPARSA